MKKRFQVMASLSSAVLWTLLLYVSCGCSFLPTMTTTMTIVAEAASTVDVNAAKSIVPVDDDPSTTTQLTTKTMEIRRRAVAASNERAILKIQPFVVEIVEMMTEQQEQEEDASSSTLVPPPSLPQLSYVQTTKVRTVVESLIRTYLTNQAPDFVVTYAALAQVLQNNTTTTTGAVSKQTTTATEPPSSSPSSTNQPNDVRTIYRLTLEGTVYVDVESSTGQIPTEPQLLHRIINEALTPTIVAEALVRTMPSIDSAQVVSLADEISPTVAPSGSPVEPPSPSPTTILPTTMAPTTLPTASATTPPTFYPTEALPEIVVPRPTTEPARQPTLAPTSSAITASPSSSSLGGTESESTSASLETSPPTATATISSGAEYGGMVAGIVALLAAIGLFVKKARNQKKTESRRSTTSGRLVTSAALDGGSSLDEEMGSDDARSGGKSTSLNENQNISNNPSSPGSPSSTGLKNNTPATSPGSSKCAARNNANSLGGGTLSSSELVVSDSTGSNHKSHEGHVSAITYLSSFFQRTNKTQTPPLNGGEDVTNDGRKPTPELLLDDMSSIYGSDADADHAQNFNDLFQGGVNVSDFDDNVSIQPDVVPVSSFHRPRQEFVVKKDMLEAQCFCGQVRDKSNQVTDYDEAHHSFNEDEDDEARKHSMIPSHYFHRRPYNGDDTTTNNLSSFFESSDFSGVNLSEGKMAIDPELKRLGTRRSTSDADRGVQPSTKSMLPKFSASWWNARSGTKDKDMNESNDRTALSPAAAADLESDGENTTFRAASSDGWDPNDSQISGSVSTQDDIFVVHNGILGDGAESLSSENDSSI